MKAQECAATQCSECGETKPRSEFSATGKTRKCKQCEARASRQRYLNREAVLERGVRRREAKADEIKAALADWYRRNRDHVLKRCKEYNARPEVKERERKRQRDRYAAKRDAIQAARKAYYESNPDAKRKLIEYQKRHYSENPSMYAARVGRRRAAQLRAVPKWADMKAIARIYRSLNGPSMMKRSVE